MYFCVAPESIKLNANGTWKHCCVLDSKADNPNGDIKALVITIFKDIRKQMLWGDKSAGCIDCVKDEATIMVPSM